MIWVMLPAGKRKGGMKDHPALQKKIKYELH